MSQLVRKRLSVQLADLMERELKAGCWGESLPGHRSLMERYAVGANTCLAAIAELEGRGIIGGSEQGRRRRVLRRPVRAARKLRDLLVIERSGIPSGGEVELLHVYRESWMKSGGSVQSVKVDYPRCRQPEAVLREAVSNHKADALLLSFPPQAWVTAAIRLRPVFLSGGEWREPFVTGIAYRMEDEVARSSARLRELGHRRIAAPINLNGKGLEAAVSQGLVVGLGLDEGIALPAGSVAICPERNPAAWREVWRKLFALHKPTAIILTDDIHYLSLLGYCYRNGIRIPADLSVVCLQDTGHLEWCQPIPARMHFPMTMATRWFQKWVRKWLCARGNEICSTGV
jgi:hypothetical protein